MIKLDEIANVENSFPKEFSNCEHRADYVIYHNVQNKESHDSNHAVIFKLDESIEEQIDAISSFYNMLSIKPRVYHSFTNCNIAKISNVFKEKGFVFEINDNRLFYREKKISLQHLPKITVKRITKYCDEIETLFKDTPWTRGVIEKSLSTNSFWFYVGYYNSFPITAASIRCFQGLSRLDDVVTMQEYRGKKYCQSLLNIILNDERITRFNDQYLYASEKDAIHIYEKLGYVEYPVKVTFWSSWK